MNTATLLLETRQRAEFERERRDNLDDALVLESAGPGLWRVCDGRVCDGPARLLAFIECRAAEFEVMQLADQFIWSVFPTMREALDHVVVSHHDMLAARPAGKSTWLR